MAKNNFSIMLFLLMLISSVGMARVDSSGYIDVGNDKIFYETAGNGSVLIFIHDGLVHREIWDEQFFFFSKNYKVIRYDRRGYGKSSGATGAYSNIEDLNNLFIHLKIESACLVALSSGGRLAIDFTLKYPNKVSSLALVGAIVRGYAFTSHFYNRGGHLPSNLSNFQQRIEYYATDDPYEIYSENISAKKKVLQLIKQYPRKGHGSSIKTPDEPPAVLRLKEIKIPVLILVGEFDIPDVHAHAGAINAGITNSKRDIIPKSGHLIPIEQPDLFNNSVLKFLKGFPDKISLRK
jgi:pimeloyl-ACP methyl ester carboxylesterase